MLTQEAIDQVKGLTEIMDGRGKIVTPVPGTPLEKLVSATRKTHEQPGVASVVNANFADEDLVYLNSTAGPNGEMNPHDLVMEDIIQNVSSDIKNHLAYAKNIVKTAVDELASETVRILSEQTTVGLSGMEVKIHNPPEPLVTTAFAGMLRNYKDIAFASPKMDLNLPAASYQEIMDNMKTGVGSIDDATAAWTARQGGVFVQKVWDEVFRLPQGQPLSSDLSFYIENRETGVEMALAIFLLANRLFDAPPEGTEMSLAAYNKTMADFRDQAGMRLSRAITELDEVVRTRTLVQSVSGKVTTVHGLVYARWIEAGGSNEVLFGNSLSNPCLYGADAINDAAPALLTAWDRYASITTQTENGKRYERTKAALDEVFCKQLASLDPQDESLCGNPDVILTMYRDLLGKVQLLEMEDLHGLCLRLLCRSRFAHTDAEFILSNIEVVMRRNQGLTVREAAASVNEMYIARWIAAQMQVASV